MRIFLAGLFAAIIGMTGCDTIRRLPLSSTNHRVNFDHNIRLDYDLVTSETGFSITLLNLMAPTTCEDVSIVTTAAYALVPNGETTQTSFIPYPINRMTPQFTCTMSGSRIVLTGAPPSSSEGFRPWADNFNIIAGRDTYNVTVVTKLTPTQLLTRGSSQSGMNLSSTFTGCGLFGTVLQRVYDCSKKIINYGVAVDPLNSLSNSTVTSSDGQSSYYTLFSQARNTTPNFADPYWFVVSCPNTRRSSQVPQQSCTWLTPIVDENNPALDTAGAYRTFTYDMMSESYQPRLLIGGQLSNGGAGYNFQNVNGFIPTLAQIYNADISPPMNPGNGTATPPPDPTKPSVCTASANAILLNDTSATVRFNANDAETRDLVSRESGATVFWDVPSYPMLNILTGGTPTLVSFFGGGSLCPSTDGQAHAPNCNVAPTNSPSNNLGFSILNVPGFTNSNVPDDLTTYLWTSSAGDSTGLAIWVYLTLDPTAYGGYVVNGARFFASLSARCVSLEWF